MNVYIDNNFLISSSESKAWQETVLLAIGQDVIRIVLSPWNIREIGNNTTENMEPLIQTAESFKPIWNLERIDLQIAEAKHAWAQFWAKKSIPFNPFGTLSQIHAVMFDCDPSRLEQFTLRDYALKHQPIVKNAASADKDDFVAITTKQETISFINRERFKNGQMRPIESVFMKRVYLARLMAYQKMKLRSQDEILLETNKILDDPQAFDALSIFAESSRMQQMRSYQIEVLLTRRHWAGSARLNSNSQIDRQHATAGLAYCDIFVTDDRQLTANVNAIRPSLNFPAAIVVKGSTFIDHLRNGTLGSLRRHS